jgi:hypothetical protein
VRMIRLLSSLLLCLALLASPAWANDVSNGTWTESDSGNNSASPNGWTSGTMTPNQVEPTARAMMGAIKRFYNHINATLTSGGTANAQTLTYSIAPAAYVTGDRYSFIVGGGLTNTGAATLNVNGLGAKSILRPDGSALVAGDLVAAGYAEAAYNGTSFLLTSWPQGEILLQKVSVSAQSQAATASFSGYTKYRLRLEGFFGSSAGATLYIGASTDGASTWLGAGQYNSLWAYTSGSATSGAGAQNFVDTTAGGFVIQTGLGTNLTHDTDVTLNLTQPTSGVMRADGTMSSVTNGGVSVGAALGGILGSTTIINGLRVFPSSGTVTGTLSLYGVR